MGLIGICLDVGAILVVAYCAHSAAKKGFVRTVIQILAYIGVILAASFLSRAAAPVLYDRVLEPALIGKYQDLAKEISQGEQAIELPQALMELLPEDLVPDQMAQDLLEDLVDETMRPILVGAIEMVGFVLCFALLTIVVNLILSALGVINYLPVVGTLNSLLGGVIGIFQGLMLVWVVALLIRGMLYLYPQGWWVFTDSMVRQTWIFRYFYDPSLLPGALSSLEQIAGVKFL